MKPRHLAGLEILFSCGDGLSIQADRNRQVRFTSDMIIFERVCGRSKICNRPHAALPLVPNHKPRKATMTTNNYFPQFEWAADAIGREPFDTSLAEQAIKASGITDIAASIAADHQERFSGMADEMLAAATEHTSATAEAFRNHGAAAHTDWAEYSAHAANLGPKLETLIPSTSALGALSGAQAFLSTYHDLTSPMRFSDFLWKDAAQANRRDFAEAIARATSGVSFDTSAVGHLAAKLDTFKVSSWETARSIAEATPGVVEAARETVKEHPEQVDELAAQITGRTGISTSDLSNDQRLTLFKEALNMIGQSAISSFSSGQPLTIVSQVTLSVVIFIIAIVQIESQVRAARDQEEDGTESGQGL